MCSSSAKRFLEENDEFIAVGDVVKNSDVIVGSKNPRIIGVPQNRMEKHQMLMKIFGEDIDIRTMKTTSLPFALEKGEVDAVLLDALAALPLKKEMVGTKDKVGDYSSYTMIATKSFYESKEFQDFRIMYNRGVDELRDDNLLNEYLLNGEKTEEGRVDKWRKWHVTMLELP
ncbi:MAG: hypothetical protein RR840_02545 [Clostridium sp.]